LAVVTPVDFGTEELSLRVVQENGQSEKETEIFMYIERDRARGREKYGHNGDGDDVV